MKVTRRQLRKIIKTNLRLVESSGAGSGANISSMKIINLFNDKTSTGQMHPKFLTKMSPLDKRLLLLLAEDVNLGMFGIQDIRLYVARNEFDDDPESHKRLINIVKIFIQKDLPKEIMWFKNHIRRRLKVVASSNSYADQQKRRSIYESILNFKKTKFVLYSDSAYKKKYQGKTSWAHYDNDTDTLHIRFTHIIKHKNVQHHELLHAFRDALKHLGNDSSLDTLFGRLKNVPKEIGVNLGIVDLPEQEWKKKIFGKYSASNQEHVDCWDDIKKWAKSKVGKSTIHGGVSRAAFRLTDRVDIRNIDDALNARKKIGEPWNSEFIDFCGLLYDLNFVHIDESMTVIRNVMDSEIEKNHDGNYKLFYKDKKKLEQLIKDILNLDKKISVATEIDKGPIYSAAVWFDQTDRTINYIANSWKTVVRNKIKSKDSIPV